MDEDKVQQNRREQDEKSTQERAAILGVQYFDARGVEQSLPLVEGTVDTETMHRSRIVPLMPGNEATAWRFGITTQTPQSLVRDLTKEYNDQGKSIQFFLISTSSYRIFMDRYDPPATVVYDDIKIAKEGDSDTMKQVSQTLNSVGSDEVFDYLIDQADRLGASDIHIENQRTHIRIRMRIDGTLHPVADLDSDRYRVILGALASRANISTASTEAQSGHI